MTDIDPTIPPKVAKRLVVAESGCWEWQGAKTYGYGRVRWNGQSSRLVHRLVYEWLVGPVPAGLELKARKA